MRRASVTIALLLLAACALVTGCAASTTGAAPSAPAGAGPVDTVTADLVLSRCTRCHSVTRIRAAIHNAAGWAVTVGRMRSHGAQLTDAEAKQVVDFLAAGGGTGL